MYRNPVFLALDLPRLETAQELARKVAGHIGGLKLGLEFFCAHGHHGVHELAKIGLPIFLDLKFHDIPNTVAAAMQAVHMLENTKVVGVTVLTSFDDKDLSGIGIDHSPHDQALRLADLAHSAGLDGIVCSGHEVGEIHRQWKNGFFVVPGLRLPDGKKGDQKRIVTPREARDGGASVLVVGRPIRSAEDPVAAARAIEATL
jgi:orotidine-5'-phosphate decarboxylase